MLYIKKKGEGFSGMTIKDTWTKPRWGGSGDGGGGGRGGEKRWTTVLEQQ